MSLLELQALDAADVVQSRDHRGGWNPADSTISIVNCGGDSPISVLIRG